MSYAKLIHEYLDEGLKGPEEDALFSELDKSPGLRSEFNQQVKLHVIAQNDMSSIAPPLETTNALFASMGFALPNAQAPVNPSPGSAFSNFWGAYSSTIYTALTAAGAAVLLTLYFLGSFSGAPESAVGNIAENERIAASSSVANAATGEVAQGNQPGQAGSGPQKAFSFPAAGPNNSENSPAGNQALVNIVPANTNNMNKKAGAPANGGSSPDENIQSSITLSSADSEILSDMPKLSRASANGSFREAPGLRGGFLIRNSQAPGFINIEDFSIELATGLNPADVSNNITPESNLNLNLGVMYKLNEEWCLGGAFGIENFKMNFDNNDNGIRNSYSAYPQLFWYSGALKYTPAYLEYNNGLAAIYGKAKLGAASDGELLNPVALYYGAELGLTVAPLKLIGPESPVKFNIGYQINGLFYETNVRGYSPVNRGLTIGIGLDLD